jgi:RNA polymerase sigma-70 factor (ECF subfamily)
MSPCRPSRPTGMTTVLAPTRPRDAGVGSRSVTGSEVIETDLAQLLEAHRRELTGFCYRMLGAGSEAEDAVQETLVRAWKAYDSFEGRSSIRSWLYRIANNVCVDMHRTPQRRARPMDLGPSSTVAAAVLRPQAENTFVLPMADGRVIDTEGDPAEVAEARESIRLAFVAALQHLPARQRAVLILCEVLRWSAVEVGELLDTTVASVNSALQRARATMASLDIDELDATVDPEHEALLARYVDAFERYDMTALAQLLRDDVVISMPPHDLWLEGPDNVIGWMVGPGHDCAGSKLVRIDVNGTAGFASYKPKGGGRWEPWAIQVIEVRDGKISGHHNFLDDHGGVRLGLFEELGLPLFLEG